LEQVCLKWCQVFEEGVFMSNNEKELILRQLPSVDEVLREDKIALLLNKYPRMLVLGAVRGSLDDRRRRILEGAAGWQDRDGVSTRVGGTFPAVDDSAGEGFVWTLPGKEVFLAEIVKEVERMVYLAARPNLRPVINATGVVLHTNLGRALLSKRAGQAVQTAVEGYSNLELDLESGRRGSRYAHLEDILMTLTGVESAMAVNNNAAAVLLALSTLAGDREVIVSRGQLVEIGGSFRIPEVMAQSGARLVEVGATNKTRPDDYRRAITDQTALLLHVHTSNYRIIGFTQETGIEELVQIGHEYNIPVMSDLGSGFLLDLQRFGLPEEPAVQAVAAAGVDVITFSGDKLLGGPQAGIILGRRECVERMKKNPLTRAIRVDKMTVAALEATLREYLDEEMALREIPTLRMLTVDLAALQKKAGGLAGMLREMIGEEAAVSVVEGFSAVGGGAMPAAVLPTASVSVSPYTISVADLMEALRVGEPAVIGRIQDEKLLLDVRTIQENEISLLAEAVQKAIKNPLRQNHILNSDS